MNTTNASAQPDPENLAQIDDARLEAEYDRFVLDTPYDAMLLESAEFRKRWFKLLQVNHRELERVAQDVTELMDTACDTKLISIIGMTGIGKTTLATELGNILMEEYREQAQPSEHPVIYVRAPANGEKSLSWKVLYRRILEAGHEPSVDQKRASRIEDGRLFGVRDGRSSVAHLREQVEGMLRHRKVRALIIDEALHLLRFSDYSAIMDTLKSLADIEPTKLILIGTHQIADLMTEYGQVIRRSEIIHYRRYRLSTKVSDHPSSDEAEYIFQLQRLQDNWPSRNKPDLVAVWRPLMSASLGSIGITKSILQQVVVQQLSTPGEVLKESHFRKAFKAPGNLRKIEEETVSGEEKLIGCCYGEGLVEEDWFPLIAGQRPTANQGARRA